MTAAEAIGLVQEEMVLDGLPTRNLATFVTTWMEPEAERGDRGKPARATSSTTPSTRSRPRSSSAASA